MECTVPAPQSSGVFSDDWLDEFLRPCHSHNRIEMSHHHRQGIRMRITRRHAIVAAAATVAAALPIAASDVGALTSTQDLSVQTAEQVAQALVGPGVTISNVNYIGADISAGTF